MEPGYTPRALNEAEGRAVLRACFEAAGYRIVEDFAFAEDGVNVSLDGWDPERRVGYEYMLRVSGDKDSFSPEQVANISRRTRNGELKILLIDGDGRPDQQILEYLVEQFLKDIARQEWTRPY